MNSQTLAQLREIAKELNVKSVTKYKKADLIEKIKEAVNKLKNDDTDATKEENKIIKENKDTDKNKDLEKEEKEILDEKHTKVDEDNKTETLMF